MQRLSIEVIDELMKNIKIRVAMENVSLKRWVTRLILKELNKSNGKT